MVLWRPETSYPDPLFYNFVVFQVFEAEMEQHKHSVSQVNSHATEVVSSCTPKLAAAIESKLDELNTKSQAVLAKCRER